MLQYMETTNEKSSFFKKKKNHNNPPKSENIEIETGWWQTLQN